MSPYYNGEALESSLYNPDGELTSVTNQSGCYSAGRDPNSGIGSSCGTTTSTNNYSYDAVGNRTDLGATYYAGNRLANFSGGWYRYDADGNVSQKYAVNPNPHNQLFYWNAENMLDSVRYDGYYTVSYKHNALGKPVLKYRNGPLSAVWLWDGDDWLAEFNATNQRTSEYLYNDLDQPYASVEGTTTPSSIHYNEQDELGNVLGTHEGTTVTESISYDPWGVPTYTGDLNSRVMWKGLMWEGDAVSLYYMRGRWYDPQAGRFIQEDPTGVDGGINVYAFAGDDPVNGRDPNGLFDQSCDGVSIYAESCGDPLKVAPGGGIGQAIGPAGGFGSEGGLGSSGVLCCNTKSGSFWSQVAEAVRRILSGGGSDADVTIFGNGGGFSGGGRGSCWPGPIDCGNAGKLFTYDAKFSTARYADPYHSFPRDMDIKILFYGEQEEPTQVRIIRSMTCQEFTEGKRACMNSAFCRTIMVLATTSFTASFARTSHE